MPIPIERCVYCDQTLTGRDHEETIYVRALRDGRWTNAACCTACWVRNDPVNEPGRFLRKKLHDAEEA